MARLLLILVPSVLIAVTSIAALDAAGGPGQATDHPTAKLADYLLANPAVKPLTRKALKPADLDGPLAFYGQEHLTKQCLEAYLDRAIVQMSCTSNEPEVWGDRAMQFLRDSKAKFNHWADLGWARLYTEEDWQRISEQMDAIHSSDWGADVIYECGIMEAIARKSVDNTRIPKWLMTALEETGIQRQRKLGPNGPGYFCYEAMFDRNAADWNKDYIGIWAKDIENEQSAPDITMLETQIYYAYQIVEYIDAGFEGIMFGQAMMTGYRDHDNSALHDLCTFAKRWAAARAYRKAVTLTSHVLCPKDYNGKPVFTHLTWPTRLSYTGKDPCGMQMGPDAKPEGVRQGGQEITALLNLPHDLPILLEIDNYGKSDGPSAVCDQGYDEITAYANCKPSQRAAFLHKYYFDSRAWKNRDGHARVHLALPAYRCLNVKLSLHTLPNGDPSEPVQAYLPFKESGGEEEMIALLFGKARMPEEFGP